MGVRIEEEPRFVHSCDLVNLSTNKAYFYHLNIKTLENKIITSKQKKFKTSGNNPIIASGGDKFLNNIAVDLIRKAAEMSPDFFMIGGDIAYTNGMGTCYRRWDEFFRQWNQYAFTVEGYYIPMLTAIGNHETIDGKLNSPKESAAEYLSYFSHKIGSHGMNQELFHYHLIGDHSLITVLDSGVVTNHQFQADWMDKLWSRKDMSKRNKITLYHVPLYPSMRPMEFEQSVLGRKYWLPIFDKHNVRLSLENHDHMFKRTFHLKNNHKSTDGTIYIGDGCFGTMSNKNVQKPWFVNKYGKFYHLWIFKLEEKMIESKAINEKGKIIDSFKIKI